MRGFLLVFLLLMVVPSFAHQMSSAYFNAHTSDTGLVDAQLQIRLYDLEQAVGVDGNGDGELLWQEVVVREQLIQDYLTANLRLTRGQQSCSMVIQEPWQVDSHFNESYLVLQLRAQCPLMGELKIHYSAFFAQDSQHKLLLNATTEMGDESVNVSRVISDDQRSVVLSETDGNRWATVREFVQQGAIHIWIGIDHIVFLIGLLLTCVLIRKDRQWVANNNIASIMRNATWIVTAFTIAHSLTLSATVLGWIDLPSRWVEVGIALTVVFAAFNNIVPLILKLGWLTFAFGLLHGMGFAGVLNELGLPGDQKLLTVLAFNLGVEIGQLVIVFVVLPILITIRKYRWYQQYGLFAASLIIILLALKWVVERL